MDDAIFRAPELVDLFTFAVVGEVRIREDAVKVVDVELGKPIVLQEVSQRKIVQRDVFAHQRFITPVR